MLGPIVWFEVGGMLKMSGILPCADGRALIGKFIFSLVRVGTRFGSDVRLSIVLTAFCFAFSAGIMPASVKAATVTCTGVGSDVINTTSHVKFDVSANTCVVANGSPSADTGDIAFLANIAAPVRIRIFADNALDAGSSTSDHLGCTVGDAGTVPAGGACDDTNVPSGTYTNTLTAHVSAGVKMTMSVTFTVVTDTSVDITAASVSTASESSAASSSSNEAVSQALQASVSRSQATVIGKNIEARVLAITTRLPADGVPEQNPGNLPSANSFVALASPATSSIQTKPALVMTSRGSSLRELAMKASFDTSDVKLFAAGDTIEGNDPLRGIEQSLGLLAGSDYTVWGHGSYTSVENEQNNAAGDSRYDGDVWGYNLGVDARLASKLVGGISMGYSQTALTTTYNSGYYDETNWTLSPYAVYQPMDGVTLSAIVGYSFGDVDLSRDSSVSGNTDSGMWFGSVSGAYLLRPSETLPLNITVNVSFLAARKTVDGYTESDGTQVGETISNTRRLKPGVEAAYIFDAAGTTLQPFAKTDFIYDITDETNGDKTAFNLGGGLRIMSDATGLSGSIEGEQQFGTSDYSEYTIGGLIAYGFAVGSTDGSSLGIVSPYFKSNFNPDNGQVFGTGFTFIGDDGVFSSEVKLTYANAAAARETVGQINIAFTF